MRRALRDVKIFKSFREQEAFEIRYYAKLSPEERQRIAKELRERVYGKEIPPIRKQKIATHYIGLSALIKNKEACGRPRDLEDLKYLREAAKKR